MAVGNPSRQFTDAEFHLLARDYGSIFLMGFHDHSRIDAQFDAAKRIVGENGQAQVFLYFDTTFWYTAWTQHWGHWARGFRRDWLLQDGNGNPIPYGPGSDTNAVGYYVDLTNSAYRSWAVKLLKAWMREAPAAGVFIDSTDPVGIAGTEVAAWERLLGPDRVSKYNDAMAQFVRRLRDVMHTVGKRVIYNGIAPSPLRDRERNEELLSVADGAYDEGFCLSVARMPQDQKLEPVPPDLAVMRRYGAERKELLLSANYLADGRRGYGPYCLAAFLMGWVPGSSYFRFGINYMTGQLAHQVREINLNLGPPAGEYVQSGEVLWRRFHNGLVAVNLGTTTAHMTVPDAVVRFANGHRIGAYPAGSTVTLATRDGAFFLDAAYVG